MNLFLQNLKLCLENSYTCYTYEILIVGATAGLIIVTGCFILAIGTYFTLKKLGKIK